MKQLNKVTTFCLSTLFCFCTSVFAANYESENKTSDPVPVDAAKDNAAVLEQLKPGLIINLKIDGTKVIEHQVQIASVTASRSLAHNDQSVSISGMDGDKTVSNVVIADQRTNAAEGVGLVYNEQRTVIGRLTVPSRINTIEVLVPGATEPQRLDVSTIFDDYCAEYKSSTLCEPAN